MSPLFWEKSSPWELVGTVCREGRRQLWWPTGPEVVWGWLLALQQRQFSSLLSCFLSWSISCRNPPAEDLTPPSSLPPTAPCSLIKVQTLSALGFHPPHSAAPSLPVDSPLLFGYFSRLLPFMLLHASVKGVCFPNSLLPVITQNGCVAMSTMQTFWLGS